MVVRGQCEEVIPKVIHAFATTRASPDDLADTHVLPPELDQFFHRVQDCAHYMPNW